MISLAQLWTLYKNWKKVKGAMKQIEGSAAYKILAISTRVDELVRDYAAYRKKRDDAALTSIKARMKAIKEELTALVMAVPDIPKPSKDMAVKYTEAVLNAKSTSEMAQMELTRVYLEQLQEHLPDDDTNFWPGRRARLVSGRDAFRRAAVGQLSIAVSVQRDIEAEERQQSELRNARDAPGIKGDANQVDMLTEDYEKSLKGEAELKEQLRGLHARAEAFAQTAEKMDQLIEAGDITHKKK